MLINQMNFQNYSSEKILYHAISTQSSDSNNTRPIPCLSLSVISEKFVLISVLVNVLVCYGLWTNLLWTSLWRRKI